MEAVVSDFGAILVKLIVPNKDGEKADVVLGFDHLEQYEENPNFFGSTVGRSANRIGGAAFQIDGVTYHLTANENENNLHSDFYHGFHNSLQISYDGISDKKTIINMTNHSYFNLAGHDAGSICDEKMMIDADAFTELGQGSICTGKVIPVEGTPMDFRTARRVGDHIDDAWPQLTLAGGYDHNWVLNTEFGKVQKFAQVEDEKAGRTMEVYTDLPGVQFYAGNFIDPQTGKDGASYGKRCALCLETQYFPNSINIPSFLQPVVEAGEAYHSVTIYKFV